MSSLKEFFERVEKNSKTVQEYADWVIPIAKTANKKGYVSKGILYIHGRMVACQDNDGLFFLDPETLADLILED